MPYSTSADIEKRLPTQMLIKLCDDEDTVTNYNDTLAAAITDNAAISDRIDAAIEDADSEINIYLRKRYAPPIVDSTGGNPDSLRKLSADLATYYLHMRRKSEMDVPDQVLRLYDRAVKILEGINRGEIDPGIEPPPTKSAAVVAKFVGPDPAFTSTTLKDF